MKKMVLILVTFLSLIFETSAYASSCGIQPFKPLNCLNGQAVCQCNGISCSWYFVGCR